MKKKNWIVPMLTAAMMFFAACGDSNDPIGGGIDDNGGNNGGNTEVPGMSASEAKQSLQNTADELLAKIKVSELDDFKQIFDGINNSVEDGNVDAVTTWFEACKENCLLAGNSKKETYLWKAANFVGEFNMDAKGNWTQTKKGGDKLVFTFFDQQHNSCVMTLKASANGTEVHHDVFDSKDWKYSYGNYEYVTRYENRLVIPEQAKVTLTQNGKTKVDITVNSTVKNGGDVDLSKIEADVTTDAVIGDYRIVVSKASYKNGKAAEAKATISKNGENLITAEANGAGSISATGDDSSVGKLAMSVDILGKAKAVAIIDDVDMLDENLDKAYDDYYSNEVEFKKCLANANKLIHANLYLNNSANSSATLYLEAVPDGTWGGTTYWNDETWLQFSDDSKYSLDSYFSEKSFKTVVDKVKDIIDDFKDMFGLDDDDDVYPEYHSNN